MYCGMCGLMSRPVSASTSAATVPALRAASRSAFCRNSERLNL